MVLITEVTAIFGLLLKAAEFSSQIRDGWYKGSAELHGFPTKVAILRLKHAQWTSLLETFGEMEDQHLRPLVNVADQILDKEQKYVRKMQSSCVLRSTRRAFPGQLTYILNELEVFVDASRKLLEERVDTHNLLERHLEQTPYPLPFGPDSKYVPLLSSITDVQNALEDANGRRVVIIHGRPGMGKSSLAKYLALHYQNAPKQHIVASSSTTQKWVPNRVFYLLCGPNARVNELQMDLLESLRGVGGSSAAQSNGSTGAPKLEGEFTRNEVSGKLRVRLAKQTVLIILDDIWEREVVENLLVPGKGVKYLLTSQIRSIWDDATKVELKNPDIAQARQIMANHTEGLPNTGEFPTDIKSVTDEIIRELDYHPLSLANIGVTIDSNRATDAEGWKVVRRNLRDLLDENDLYCRPLVYQKSYPLTVDASMMLMVNSLPPEPQHLLFLIVLLQPSYPRFNSPIPEALIQFFLKFVQPAERRWRYQNCIKYLEDRSLVDLRSSRAGDIIIDEVNTNRFDLATHGLRTYYIKRKHIADMKSIATEILTGRSQSSDHGGQLVQSGSTEETRALSMILAAMYFDEHFRDLVAPKLESHITILNGRVIPRSMSYGVDARDLMGKVHSLKYHLRSLVWLLNLDGQGGWKSRAHDYATKVVIRLVFRKELDDNSMASLIRLPQTTIAACETLSIIVRYYLDDAFAHAYLDQKRPFSIAHEKTMDSLLCLLHDSVATMSRRAATISPLSSILGYETEDTILRVAKKWVEFLAKDSNLTLQIVVASKLYSFRTRLSRAEILVGEFPELLDRLLILTVEGKDPFLQYVAVAAIHYLCQSTNFLSQTMAFPGALNILFKKFLSSDQRDVNTYTFSPGYWAGGVLRLFSCSPRNGVRFTTIGDSLKELTEMLNSISKPQSSGIRHEYSAMAAEIVGNLALTSEVRKVILHTAPQIGEDLVRLLQLWMSSVDDPQMLTVRKAEMMTSILSISRAVTIMDPLQAKATITTIPRPHPRVCFEVYMGRVRGYMEMRMYSDALKAFSVISDQFSPDEDGYGLSWVSWLWFNNQRFAMPSRNSWWRKFLHDFRPLRLFLKAMTEDYTGAMLDANRLVRYFQDNMKKYPNTWARYIPFLGWMSLGERGVLKRLSRVDLREALADLDEALKYFYHSQCLIESSTSEELNPHKVCYGCLKRTSEDPNPHKVWYGCLKHRGLVKTMMGDEVGGRADAESAVQLKLDRLVYEDTNDILGPTCLLDLPVDYLGFTL